MHGIALHVRLPGMWINAFLLDDISFTRVTYIAWSNTPKHNYNMSQMEKGDIPGNQAHECH